MSKSIEELKAEYHAANDRAKQAVDEAREARRILDDARLQATGFKGCIAEFDEMRGWDSRSKKITCRFRVESIGAWGNRIEGHLIKQDGKIGAVIKRCDVDQARNLGPYNPDEAPHA